MSKAAEEKTDYSGSYLVQEELKALEATFFNTIFLFYFGISPFMTEPLFANRDFFGDITSGGK